MLWFAKYIIANVTARWEIDGSEKLCLQITPAAQYIEIVNTEGQYTYFMSGTFDDDLNLGNLVIFSSIVKLKSPPILFLRRYCGSISRPIR